MGRSRSPSGDRRRSRSRSRGRPRSRSRNGREFCKDFTRGECNRGNICRFSHDFKPAIPARGDSGGPAAGAGAGAGAMGRPLGASSLATFDSHGKEMCGDFKRGDCRRGDRCRYSHGDSSPMPQAPMGPMMGMPPMMGPMGPMLPAMGMPPMMGPMGMMPPPMGVPPMGMHPMGMPPGMGMLPPMGMPPHMAGPAGPPREQSRRPSSSSSRERGRARKNGKRGEPAVRKKVPIDIDEL